MQPDITFMCPYCVRTRKVETPPAIAAGEMTDLYFCPSCDNPLLFALPPGGERAKAFKTLEKLADWLEREGYGE